jgi:hypothetical protein
VFCDLDSSELLETERRSDKADFRPSTAALTSRREGLGKGLSRVFISFHKHHKLK